MMQAAFEDFKLSISSMDRDALFNLSLSLFTEKEQVNEELSGLLEVHNGMVREYEKLKTIYEKCEEERISLLKQNQHLTDVANLRTNSLFGRSTEKTADILEESTVAADTGQEDPLDEDADDQDPGESQDVGHMTEAEIRQLLFELLGNKKKKKKEKGKRERDLSKLVKRECYLYDTEEFDRLYGEGWKIIHWDTRRTVEKVRPGCYLQVTYYPIIETVDGQVFSPYWVEPLIEKSLVSPSLMSSIWHDKYSMFLPYYRLENDPDRYGFPISRQTMSYWEIHICEEFLMPVYDYLREQMRGFEYQHCDETTWMVVKDGRSPGTKGYFWVHLSGELLPGYRVIYISFELTRAATHLINFFEGVDHKVHLTDDAYAGYRTAQKEYPEMITICGCLTHLRRRFVNAVRILRIPSGTSADELREIPEYKCILMIAKIYSIDGSLKVLSADERLQVRQEKIKPEFDGFIDYIKGIDITNPDITDTFRDAVEYTINHETELRQFLNDGNIPIDNGDCERHIRNIARLRVNSLFSTTKRGADASAVVMSLMETAKLNGADPYYYMKYLLEELPKHLYQDPSTYVEDMMPWTEQYRAYESSERQKMSDQMILPRGDIKPGIKSKLKIIKVA